MSTQKPQQPLTLSILWEGGAWRWQTFSSEPTRSLRPGVCDPTSHHPFSVVCHQTPLFLSSHEDQFLNAFASCTHFVWGEGGGAVGRHIVEYPPAEKGGNENAPQPKLFILFVLLFFISMRSLPPSPRQGGIPRLPGRLAAPMNAECYPGPPSPLATGPLVTRPLPRRRHRLLWRCGLFCARCSARQALPGVSPLTPDGFWTNRLLARGARNCLCSSRQ